MSELRQTSNYAKYMELIGWSVDRVRKIYIYSRNIPILGRFTKIQRPADTLNEIEVKDFIRRRKTFIVHLEPINKDQEDYYLSLGYKKTNSTSLPSKTVQIDLSQSKSSLLKEMHHKTRYNIKHAESLGVEVKISNDIDIFSQFWHQSARKRGMIFSLDKEIKAIYKAFGSKAKIFTAFYKYSPLAMVMTLDSDLASHYMYAAANEQGKKLFAPTLVTWKAIIAAKKRGIKNFDFEGIFDERFPIKNWRGFTRFKKSFGGQEKDYPGILKRYFFYLK